MKLSASTPEEQRRQYLLLGVLAVVALGVLYTQFGGGTTSEPFAASNLPVTTTPSAVTGGGQAGSGLPEPLQMSALESAASQQQGARNPFGFGSRPAPPPPPPPAPTPAPPVRTAPPPPSGPPPLPPIPVKYLGYMEDPAHPGKVVALGVAGGVTLAREGDLVEGRYRLVKVGLQSIVMAYGDGRGQQTIRLSGS